MWNAKITLIFLVRHVISDIHAVCLDKKHQDLFPADILATHTAWSFFVKSLLNHYWLSCFWYYLASIFIVHNKVKICMKFTHVFTCICMLWFLALVHMTIHLATLYLGQLIHELILCSSPHPTHRMEGCTGQGGTRGLC